MGTESVADEWLSLALREQERFQRQVEGIHSLRSSRSGTSTCLEVVSAEYLVPVYTS
jgi:hypothetical protein